MKKRLFSVLFACLFALCCFTAVSAASASVKLSLSASTVNVGNQVKVTVQISSSDTIGSWDLSLSYDPAYLQYVSGADSGGGGKLRFVDSSDGTKSVSKTVTFKTLKIGSTKVSVSSPQIIDFNTMTPMSATGADRTIKIQAAPERSGDNKLSALAVSAGVLDPAFSPDVTQYTLSVPFNVTQLAVSATPNHSGASVAVSDSNLVVGENTVTVTVQAENGTKKDYVIMVTRNESALAGSTVEINGVTHTVEFDPSQLEIPEGYQEISADYGDKEILAFSSPKNSITICYLKTEAGGAWYLYDTKNQTFSPLVRIPSPAASFVILPLPEGVLLPAGFVPTTVTVGETACPAYKAQDSETKNIYLTYAMAPDGACGFYFFDAVRNSFVTYYSGDSLAGAIMGETDLSTRLQEAEAKAKTLKILTLSFAILVVLLAAGIVLVAVFVRRPKKEEAENEPDDFLRDVKPMKGRDRILFDDSDKK